MWSKQRGVASGDHAPAGSGFAVPGWRQSPPQIQYWPGPLLLPLHRGRPPLEQPVCTMWRKRWKQRTSQSPCPLPHPHQVTSPGWWGLSRKAQSSNSKVHIGINENQLDLSWAEAEEEISALRVFFFLYKMLIMGWTQKECAFLRWIS